jgi:hypothetical protein
MSDIELDTLSYTKPEIDDKLTDEREYTDNGLSLKIDKSEIGGDYGLVRLIASKVPPNNIPFATSQQASDGTSTTTVMSPALVHQEMYDIAYQYIPNSEKGTAQGVASLDFSAKIPIAQIPALGYIDASEKANPNGVASLDANGKVPQAQIPDTGSVSSYVVDTVADMVALTGINEGDRCLVVDNPSDTSKEREYVATKDDPVVEADWSPVPTYNAVSSVNGQTGSVTITSIDESAANKVDIASNTTQLNTLDAKVSAFKTTDLNDCKNQRIMCLYLFLLWFAADFCD